MYLKILIYYIFGYVNVIIEGFFIEKVINKCISKRIFLWNTRRSKSTIFSANVGVRNYRDIVKIAKECKCKIKINKKRGLPFVLNRYRKRKIFAIALVAIMVVIITISNFVWNIEIRRCR